jgi:hypothetical protein
MFIMKKILSIFLVVSIMSAMLLSTAFADEQPEPAQVLQEDEISVYVDGEKLEFDVPPQLINSRTMVPMRFIFEKLGAVVSYDEETETVTAFLQDGDEEATIVILQIGNPVGFTNNSQIELEAAPVLIDGRTLVPVRFVSESLGYEVDWEEGSKSVIITSKTEEESKEVEETEDKEETVLDDEDLDIEENFDEEDAWYEEMLDQEILDEEIYDDGDIIEE